MAVKISEVKLSPQEVTVGETITITIKAVDVTWGILKNDFVDWNKIKNSLSNWRYVLNHH